MWRELASSARHGAEGGAIFVEGQSGIFSEPWWSGMWEKNGLCGFLGKFCGLEIIAQPSQGRKLEC